MCGKTKQNKKRKKVIFQTFQFIILIFYRKFLFVLVTEVIYIFFKSHISVV